MSIVAQPSKQTLCWGRCGATSEYYTNSLLATGYYGDLSRPYLLLGWCRNFTKNGINTTMFIRKIPAAWLLRSIMCSALVFGLAACSSSDDDVMTPPIDGGDGMTDDDPVQETVNTDGTSTFIVPLSAEQEVPAVDLELATGEGNLSIDRATGAISGSVTVSDLSGQAQTAHIHSGLGGSNGGALVVLAGNDDGSEWTVPADSVLDADALIALGNGGLYLNVHTTDNPGGEVRGQIIPLGILFEDSELSGGEEVPLVVTDASGVGVSTVD
jgi:hypothetical protein